MFRTVPQFYLLSKNALNYTRYLTPRSIARQPSPIRALTAIQAQAGPEMISLAAGAPNPELFPFEEIQLKVKGSDQIIKMEGSNLNKALQYSPTIGFPPLLKHFQNLQKIEHSYNPELHDIVITPGSQDGLSKVLEAMVNRGDKVIVDAPIYSGTLAILKPIGARLIGIETDEHGMNTDILEKSLKRNGKADGAKLIVTVSNGSNPTGGSLSLERRKRMLEIAEQYDCFIIEDDPYYWLSYDQEKLPSLFKLAQNTISPTAPGGRVLRSDSLSKIVSSGIRLGWQTGPKEIIDRVVKAQEASSMHTSTLSQALVAELFENSWNGVEGFREQSDKVVAFYKSRCDAIDEICQKHLGSLCSWKKPKAGMFLWVKINGIQDSRKLIKEGAIKKNVLAVDGQCFEPNDRVSSYMRLSFSQETPERMEVAVKRLAELIREELYKQSQTKEKE